MFHIASKELWSFAVDWSNVVPVGRFQASNTIMWPPYRIPVPYSAALQAPQYLSTRPLFIIGDHPALTYHPTFYSIIRNRVLSY